ncbi:MAG: ABC transporter ATP-binding protein [Candidatus Korobacteraceae bacterium]
MGKSARECWLHLVGILGLSIVSTPIALLIPLPLKIAVDSVLGHEPVPRWLWFLIPPGASRASCLVLAAALLLAIALVGSLQSLASWLLQTYTGEKLVHNLRSRLLWHVQRLSLAFHDRRGTNDTTYRIQYDASAIQNVLIQGLVPIAGSVFAFAAMLYVTARINWRLALVALALSPVLWLLARKSSHKVRSGYDEVRALDSSAMLVLHEALASLRAVKAFCREAHEDELFRRKSRQRMVEQVRLASIQAGFHVLMGLTVAVGTAAALLIGVGQVLAGAITVGELLLVMAYMAQLYEPLRNVSSKIPELQGAITSVRRAFALFDEIPELGQASPSITAKSIRGHFFFRDVSFEYTPGRRVLHNISFEIEAGARVGIVGPSGSGKTTLVHMLTRFYDPVEGCILLDGIDLRNYKLADLRQQFSIVLQDPMLFSTTVAANIAYARADAKRAEVVEAAKLAGAHEFIMRLPQGYDTPIGEGGAGLSGGERQRLAIARAFLKDSPVLILDEPTSAIDVKTERFIISAMEKLVHGRTTFMIAHRLSTLERCDQVLVLREGHLTSIASDLQQARRELLNNPEQPAGPNLGPVLVR